MNKGPSSVHIYSATLLILDMELHFWQKVNTQNSVLNVCNYFHVCLVITYYSKLRADCCQVISLKISKHFVFGSQGQGGRLMNSVEDCNKRA